jgi:hypothetical protein
VLLFHDFLFVLKKKCDHVLRRLCVSCQLRSANTKQKFHHGQAAIGNLLMIRQLSDHNNQPIAQQNKETGSRLNGRR